MKLALIVAMFMSSLLISMPAFSTTQHDIIEQTRATTHTFYVGTVLEEHKCSATAIGPHALLTATHCELGADVIGVDNPDREIKVIRIVRDGADHSIYYLDKTFEKYATVNSATPEVGDNIFMLGGPANLVGIYRRGYVAKVEETGFFVQQTLIVYDLNGFHGDSGAGMFNEQGELVGVLTGGVMLDQKSTHSEDDMTAKFMTGLGLKFTLAQLEEARQQ